MPDTDAAAGLYRSERRRSDAPPQRSSRALHPAAMRWQNISSLLQAVVTAGPLARVELVEQTGISSATVTKLVGSMLDAELLVERSERSSVGLTGRPRVPVDLNRSSRVVLGLHIGATRCTVAVLDLRAGMVAERVVWHRQPTPEAVIDSAVSELRGLQARLPGRRVVGLGVSSGGRVDHRSGTLLAHPALGWRDVGVRSLVEARVDVPIEYDETVRGTALAELIYGSAQRLEHVLHLFVGNVLGSALVVRGSLHRGATGNAGGMTHLPVLGVRGPVCECGQTNCLSQVASNTGLIAIATKRGMVKADASYETLLASAADGDQRVQSLLRARGRWIGRAIAGLADFLDPAAVLLSGNADEWPDYFDTVRAAVAARSDSGADAAERVRRPSFQGHSSTVSSAVLFLDQYFRDPVRYEPALQRRLSA